MSFRTLTAALVGFAFLSACGISSPPKDPGDISGIPELGQPLNAANQTPVWTSASGQLDITFDPAGGETLILSSHPVSGAILLNDVATGATTKTIKKITVTGSAKDDIFILDYANAIFAPGTATASGIDVDLKAATNNDAFKVRTTSNADTITLGGTSTAAKVAVNTDAYLDINVVATKAVLFTFTLGAGNDIFNALAGTYGTGGAAFTGDVTVYGGTNDDTLTGGDGNDTLYGDLGNDTLNGGSVKTDSDIYYGGAGSDTVTYASRTAAITVTIGDSLGTQSNDDGESGEKDDITNDVEIVQGGSGNDTFTGESGNQTFYGNNGNDTFLMGTYATTGAGDDTFYGGAGIDVVDYSSRVGNVTATMDLGKADDGETGEKDNIQNDIENFLCPTGAVTCTVTGNTLDNTLTSGGGIATFSGGAGDDTFVIAALSDFAHVIAGGAGVDTVDFSSFGAVIDVKMDNTVSLAPAGLKIGLDIENLKCDAAAACTVVGNPLNNHIWGSSAADNITTGAGDDLIETNDGASGLDTLDCGDGSDIVYGLSAAATACEL